MKNITKEFPGVKALKDVTFHVKRGEIHALCGENGAGKSTLMKVLGGVYSYGSYSGDIIVDGITKQFNRIKDAEAAGISIIYQELTLVKELSVGENIFLGNEPKGFLGTFDWDRLNMESEVWLHKVGLQSISPERLTGTLGIGQQQLIEIAKALSKNTKILILDEPTAALAEHEVGILLNLLRELRKDGVTCIYISHKLNEVFDIADTITVLRDGATVASHPASELTQDKVISLMVGRELNERYPSITFNPTDVAMSVSQYSVWDHHQQNRKIIDNISLDIRKGEVLGIAGLVGSGRSELVMSLFGSFHGEAKGTVMIDGKPTTIKNAEHAIKNGLALVSEDRKKYGLVLSESILKNITLSSLPKVSSVGIIDENEEARYTNQFMNALKIKANSAETVVGTLSGGNQQKVVLGKWLLTNPKILILDEPTRGIDVGAKYEIYMIIKQLAESGTAIIMISSELPEVLGMSNRILVMNEGRFTAEFDRNEATQEKIMLAATGGKMYGHEHEY
ncbi:xylose ABC transporter ATP-binding protein [Cohnella faecalis]|uniref:xylose ABC transporter ATP-binding protein n=1 Tax=Cohnella faecalis TaxID=2315694 RepID=UPI003605E02B